MASDPPAAHEADGVSTSPRADPPTHAGAQPPDHDDEQSAARPRKSDKPGDDGGKHYEPL